MSWLSPKSSGGALDIQATPINEEIKIAAVLAISSLIAAQELSADYVIPSPFDEWVAPAVAKAVADAGAETGVSQKAVAAAKQQADSYHIKCHNRDWIKNHIEKWQKSELAERTS